MHARGRGGEDERHTHPLGCRRAEPPPRRPTRKLFWVGYRGFIAFWSLPPSSWYTTICPSGRCDTYWPITLPSASPPPTTSNISTSPCPFVLCAHWSTTR